MPALGVWLANTKLTVGLLRALIVQPGNIQLVSIHPWTFAKTVPLIQHLQLVASPTPLVNVTPGL